MIKTLMKVAQRELQQRDVVTEYLLITDTKPLKSPTQPLHQRGFTERFGMLLQKLAFCINDRHFLLYSLLAQQRCGDHIT
ncbi:hypothetical protein [Pantoea rodasii]|uniref:hypothetical protein n=1 Tax=Pantoea rodasii TaxID=1076549 RepID=UPI003452ED66